MFGSAALDELHEEGERLATAMGYNRGLDRNRDGVAYERMTDDVTVAFCTFRLNVNGTSRAVDAVRFQ